MVSQPQLLLIPYLLLHARHSHNLFEINLMRGLKYMTKELLS